MKRKHAVEAIKAILAAIDDDDIEIHSGEGSALPRVPGEAPFIRADAKRGALEEAWDLGVIHGHNVEGRLIDKRSVNPYQKASNE